MGIYLNPENYMFWEAQNSQFFVDKNASGESTMFKHHSCRIERA